MKVKKMKVTDLTQADINRLFQIYSNAYDHTDRTVFAEDLQKKQFIFLGQDNGNQEIVGFSTLEVKFFNFEEKKICYFFSGDTMILPEYWGQKSLHTAFALNAFLYKIKNPSHHVIWYLICMGYRTYLIMAKNCPIYFPRYDQETPGFYQNLIDTISTQKFGTQYKINRGVIVPDQATTLSEHVAPITGDILNVPQVHFLIQKNSNYHLGEEMACVAELDFGMLSFWVHKTIIQIFKKLKKKIDLFNTTQNESEASRTNL